MYQHSHLGNMVCHLAKRPSQHIPSFMRARHRGCFLVPAPSIWDLAASTRGQNVNDSLE